MIRGIKILLIFALTLKLSTESAVVNDSNWVNSYTKHHPRFADSSRGLNVWVVTFHLPVRFLTLTNMKCVDATLNNVLYSVTANKSCSVLTTLTTGTNHVMAIVDEVKNTLKEKQAVNSEQDTLIKGKHGRYTSLTYTEQTGTTLSNYCGEIKSSLC